MVQVDLLLPVTYYYSRRVVLFRNKYECNNNIFCLPIMKTTFKMPRTIDCHNTCYVSFWDEEDPLLTRHIALCICQ